MLTHVSHKAYRILIQAFYWSRSIIYKSWISRITIVEGDKDVSKQDATSNTFGYGWNTGCIHGVTEEQGCSECTAWFYTDVKDRATILKHTHVSHKVRKFMMNFFSNLLFFSVYYFFTVIRAFRILAFNPSPKKPRGQHASKLIRPAWYP